MLTKNTRYKWLVTATVSNTKISEIDNETPNTSSFANATVLNTKISEVQNKISNSSKYVATQEFNKLMAENFETRLKQADLVNKTDFDNKLTSLNKRITSIKRKYLEILMKLNPLVTKDYDFFLCRIYFK